MCGRFVSATPPDQIARYFDAVDDTAEAAEPNFNVAPTTDIYVVRSDGHVRRLEQLHWGLVPFWAKDPSVGNRMINARAEGIAEKNAYKRSFRPASLHHPGGRLLRVDRRPRPEEEAADVHPAGRR